MAEFISIKDLSVWYKKDCPILSDFSINIKKNEVIGLIGLNGAGKTTLIKTMSGLLDTFHAESIEYNGSSVSFRDNLFKKNRYIVFAEEHSFQYFTFREYLSYTAKSYKLPIPDVSELIKGFQFEQYTDCLLRELSTGNLKKAYLITAFALHPELLLLDEPVNGLDFHSTEYLYRLMANYKKYGTILFSSHILESICFTSDRVIVLENGKIKSSFSGNEIESKNIREALGYGKSNI